MTTAIHPDLAPELAKLQEAEHAVGLARAALARRALEIARSDGGRGDVYDRAGALAGVTKRTILRWLQVTKNVTSQDAW